MHTINNPQINPVRYRSPSTSKRSKPKTSPDIWKKRVEEFQRSVKSIAQRLDEIEDEVTALSEAGFPVDIHAIVEKHGFNYKKYLCTLIQLDRKYPYFI